MPLYSNQAIVRVVIRYTLDGQLVENVWTVRTRNGGILDEDIALTIRQEIVRRFLPRQTDELTCDIISVQEIFPVPTDPHELAVAESGSIEGDPLPTAMAVVMAMKTGLGGRRNRGRKYLSAVPEADVEASRLTAARLADWQGAANLVMAYFAPGNALANLDLGVLHRVNAGAPVPLSADSFVPVTSLIVRPVLGTMRSRIPGHGN